MPSSVSWFKPFLLVFPRCECYDYLFDLAAQMRRCGLDPAATPTGEEGIV